MTIISVSNNITHNFHKPPTGHHPGDGGGRPLPQVLPGPHPVHLWQPRVSPQEEQGLQLNVAEGGPAQDEEVGVPGRKDLQRLFFSLDPWTSCMQVRSRSHYATGAAPDFQRFSHKFSEEKLKLLRQFQVSVRLWGWRKVNCHLMPFPTARSLP